MSGSRGDGPYTHGGAGSGNSFANGNVMPRWARGWEFQELRASQSSTWSVMA